MNSDFRSRVESQLRKKGMTQRSLAAEPGVSEVTVSRWLADGDNGRNPNVQVLPLLQLL